jgi:hypothetical protein
MNERRYIMADVNKFILDGTQIDVEDNVARTTASAASSQASANAQDIADLKALSRLTVSYDATTKAMTFTTSAHSTT